MKQNIVRHSRESNRPNLNIGTYKKRSLRNSVNNHETTQPQMQMSSRNQFPAKASTTYIYKSQQLNGNSQQRQRLSTSMTIRTTKQKVFSPWINENHAQKPSIKWIGVHHSINQNSHHIKFNNFAFPKRKQKNYDQSLSNFLLKYGKTVKKNQIQQADAKSIFRNTNNIENCVTNAATSKIKPRISWFERKRPITTSKKSQYMALAKESSRTFKK